MLAVAEGYDTFNIVFMGIGDSQTSECSSVSSAQKLTVSVWRILDKTVILERRFDVFANTLWSSENTPL